MNSIVFWKQWHLLPSVLNRENIVRIYWGKVEYNGLMARLFGKHLAVTQLDDYGNESEPMEIKDL